MMSDFRDDIPVTYEFEDFIPPEEDGVIFEPKDDSRMMMSEPEIAYTMGDNDKDKREAFLNSEPKSEPFKKQEKKKMELPAADNPAWWNGKSINTTIFCKEFLKNNDLRCVNGTFFTPDGYCPTDRLKRDIYNIIKNHVVSFPIQTAGNIVENLKAEAATDELMVDDNIINFANGTFNISNCQWTDEKFFCRNRLAAAYTNVAGKDPENWIKFVGELLEPDDVLTLQEFMGYCLIPSTAAQKMLLIIGNGGEGKSRIGVVMRAILGDNMNNGSIPKIETNSFARADLEHKLLMVDDDMRMENLPTTNNLKALITAEGPMDLEKKGVQSYQGLMYCRLMAFSNGYMKSTNDDSYGFFRRQLILMTKPRPKDRVDDPFLSRKLVAERDMIAIWALAGLFRLRKNNFHFTMSDRTKAAIKTAMDEANNVVGFLRSKGSFTFDPEGSISSRALYNIYRMWCEDNAEPALDQKKVISYVRSHAHEYGLNYTMVQNEYKWVRGFRGIKAGLATPINPVRSA